MESQGFPPGLTVVLVGDDAPSAAYVRGKEKASQETGFNGQVMHLPGSTPESEMLAIINQLNADAAVHGILVQLPFPDHIDIYLITSFDACRLHPYHAK